MSHNLKVSEFLAAPARQVAVPQTIDLPVLSGCAAIRPQHLAKIQIQPYVRSVLPCRRMHGSASSRHCRHYTATRQIACLLLRKARVVLVRTGAITAQYAICQRLLCCLWRHCTLPTCVVAGVLTAADRGLFAIAWCSKAATQLLCVQIATSAQHVLLRCIEAVLMLPFCLHMEALCRALCRLAAAWHSMYALHCIGNGYNSPMMQP